MIVLNRKEMENLKHNGSMSISVSRGMYSIRDIVKITLDVEYDNTQSYVRIIQLTANSDKDIVNLREVSVWDYFDYLSEKRKQEKLKNTYYRIPY